MLVDRVVNLEPLKSQVLIKIRNFSNNINVHANRYNKAQANFNSFGDYLLGFSGGQTHLKSTAIKFITP